MPDRQSSPDEATEHPDAGAPGTANGSPPAAGSDQAERSTTPDVHHVADRAAAQSETGWLGAGSAVSGAGERPSGRSPSAAGGRAASAEASTSLFDPVVPYQGEDTFAAGEPTGKQPAGGSATPVDEEPPPGSTDTTQALPARSTASVAAAEPAAAASTTAGEPSAGPSLAKKPGSAKPAAASPAEGSTVRVAVPPAGSAGAGTESPTTALPVAAQAATQKAATQQVATQQAATQQAATQQVDSATTTVGAGPDSWDAEATQVIPVKPPGAQNGRGPTPPGGESPTERIRIPQPAAAAAAGDATRVSPPPPGAGFGAPRPEPQRPGGGFGGNPPPPAGDLDGEPRPKRRRRGLLVGALVVLLLAVLYVGDLVLNSGSVPRGVTVEGVEVGGLSLAAAEERLRAEIEPRTLQPIPVSVGEVTSEIDPATAGLAIDWAGTLRQAGEQPLNPITRLTSLFTSRDVGVVTSTDDEALAGAVGELAPVVNREPVEGTVRFEDTEPVAVDPVPGQELDQAAAIEVLENEWVSGMPVTLPLTPLPAVTTAEDVATAISDVARPAVSAPVTVLGENDLEATLEPETIAEALSFEPGEGGLVPVLNPTVITEALTPQLAGSEQEARDATFDFTSAPPTLVPSQDGRGVDYDATLVDLLTVLTGTDAREITALYTEQPADITTEDLQALGNPEVIGTFTTGGFAQDSGQNIRRAAELINGLVVQPGETFSLDAATGPRTLANGYVEAGVIDNGQPGRGPAGGVSQVSTTLYNAAYFAGMTDIEHRAHSFYISRYPPGREATIATGAIDNRFRNDSPSPVLIRTDWTPSSVTVTLYGTKVYDVTSTPGPRTNPTEPNTVNIPAGEPCRASNGSGGFTVTDTRTLRNIATGEVRTETSTTRYNPIPRVVCG